MKSMKFHKIIVIFLVIFPAFLLCSNIQADVPSITIQGFQVQPSSIPYTSSSTLTYNFTLTTPDANATKNYCSTSVNRAVGDIDWAIKENNTAQVVANGLIKVDELLSLTVSKNGQFSYSPQGSQTAANFQLVISCDAANTFSQITQSAVVPIGITGQASGVVSIVFGSDKTNQNVAPNSNLPVEFQLAIVGKQSYLLQKCTGTTSNSNVTYAIFQFSTNNPSDRSNQIFAGNIPFNSFGAEWSTIPKIIPLTVKIPGSDIGFIAQARCNGDTILTETSQLTIYAGGAGGKKYSCNSSNACVEDANGTYTDSNCNYKCTAATQDQSYTFNITNPLKGGPNDLFDIINIVTQWILYISIPLAVLWIMYAGFLMLTAGPKPENFKKGRDILTYTVIGLAIIFIGKGFVSLIISVIQLGGTSPTTTQGPIGSACTQNTNCQTGLICNNICQRSSGNVAGEPCMSVLNCSLGFTCNKTGSTGTQDIGKCVQQ